MFDTLDLQSLIGLFYDGGDGGATPPPTPPPGGADDPVRTFKQSELDHLFAERARQAQGKAVTDLLKDLGVEKADDLKAFIQKAKDAENASKTELQKLQDQLAAKDKEISTAKTERDTALATATDRLMKAAVIGEATKTFDETELVSVWMALKADAALLAKIKVKEDGENFDGIADALKEIAKAHPRWIKTQNTGGIGTPRPGAGSKPGSPNPSGGDKKPLGIRL